MGNKNANGATAFSFNDHNQRVSEARGENWRKNVIKGKANARFIPTILRLIRSERGISQTDMLEGTDIRALTTYGRIELGDVNVRRERALMIAEKLGVNVNKIFKKSTQNNIGKNRYRAIKSGD